MLAYRTKEVKSYISIQMPGAALFGEIDRGGVMDFRGGRFPGSSSENS